MKRKCSQCGKKKPSTEFGTLHYQTVKGVKRYRFKAICEDCEKK